METEGAREVEKAREGKRATLRSQQWNNRVYVGVDLPWRGSPKTVAKQSRFFDKILEIAELPEHDQWPKIIALSQRHDIPAIRNRVGPSPLETNAAALLTGLAFTNHKDWPRLIRTFFKIHNLTIGLRGRPTLQIRDTKDMNRGTQITKLIALLKKGFEIKLTAKRRRGFAGDEEQMSRKLRDLGYADKEIKAILKSKTLQDAGCRLYFAINGGKDNVTLQRIRNGYARYKRLSKEASDLTAVLKTVE